MPVLWLFQVAVYSGRKIRTAIERMLKKSIHSLLILMIAAAAVLIPAGTGEYCSYAAAGPQSSFEYKKFDTSEKYMEELRSRMYNVYRNISGRTDEEKTFPIPGLVYTYTRQDGKISDSDDYVPQGLCRAGNYMLITAYDVKKKHNSVIYAVDTVNNRLVSTLTMPNKYHAGGIAFDGECIWTTGNTSDKYQGAPFVQYMTYETFLRLIKEPVCEVRKSDISEPVYIKNKPSFLECNDGTLWVGTYTGNKGTAEGYMNGYQIVGPPEDRRLNTIMYRVLSGIDSCSQGADIDGKYLYVSSSYNGVVQGVRTSFITKYNLAAADNGSDSIQVGGWEVSRIEVPKMNEEIVVEGNMIHINFESGSKHWRLAVVNTDRILAVRKNIWGQ